MNNRLEQRFRAGYLLLGLCLTGLLTAIAAQAAEPAQPAMAAGYGKLPLSFVENRGQVDPAVRFMSRGPGYSLFLTAAETVLTLTARDAKAPAHPSPAGRNPLAHGQPPAAAPERRTALRMTLVGGQPPRAIAGREPLPGVVNVFRGQDPAQWRTGLPTFGKVEERGVYPGIDLVFYGNPQQLEYDFLVQPGADPKAIRLRFEATDPTRHGARFKPRLDAAGNLIVPTALGDVRLQKPVVYQEIAGQKHPLDGRFVVHAPKSGQRHQATRGTEVGFQVAAYDASQPLVIDPVLVYSTYLGGTGGDYGNDIAVDGAGNAYVTGTTRSTDFPTANALDGTYGGGNGDAFVTKLNPGGTQMLYSTYLGGNEGDGGEAIAVDEAGNAYVTGTTRSTDFPTANALDATLGGGSDSFVTKLNPSGSQMIYSTFLGGNGDDGCAPCGEQWGIAVDEAGNAYVTGTTRSTDFPTANALDATLGGGSDSFVTKLNPSGSQMIYSTFLGGKSWDQGYAIALDGAGNAYVTGRTWSTDFPTVNALDGTYGGGNGDAFVTKLNPGGTQMLYSTYLGGNEGDGGEAIAVDGAGNAYVTGNT